jgi:hypothetical protein
MYIIYNILVKLNLSISLNLPFFMVKLSHIFHPAFENAQYIAVIHGCPASLDFIYAGDHAALIFL